MGTYDNFTDGDPSDFLRNLNAHMPTADQNKLIFIEKTGHTYQMKHQEVADDILEQLKEWRCAYCPLLLIEGINAYNTHRRTHENCTKAVLMQSFNYEDFVYAIQTTTYNPLIHQ